MGKRPTRTNNVEGMEVDAIKVALRDIEKQQKTQSDTMKEVLILLRGSVAMGVNGILEDHKVGTMVAIVLGIKELMG